MPSNNQAQDRYNAPSVRSTDWNDFYYSDLEVNELFWLNNNSADGNRNHAHRKLTDTGECMNLITREVKMFGNIKVFQKD